MKKRAICSLLSAAVLTGVLTVGPAVAAGPGYSEAELTDTVTLNDADLEQEAARFGIPGSRTKRYVVEARALNQLYQQGSLTRTEYVGSKRNLIENLQ